MKLNNNMDFLLFECGEPFLLNGVTHRGLFVEATEKISYYDDVIVTCTIPLETGSVIQYQSVTWLVVSQVQNNEDTDTSIYKVRIQKSNNIIIVNVSGILHVVPIIVTDKVALNVDVNTYITTLDNEIYILVQNDAINSNIKLNNIYKIGNLNYQVKSIDDISKQGLLYVKMDFSEVAQVLPVYSIQILNGESTTTNIDTPIQLNIQIMDGDTILTEPLPMVYVSSDEAIATIDSDGLITPVSLGSVTITVALEFDPEVNDSIALTVDEMPVLDNFTYTLTASITPITEVKTGQTKTYTAHKFNNGVEVAGLFDWSVVPGTTAPTAYTFTILNDTQCTIKANAYTYYIDLFANDRDIPENSVSIHIKLKSIF